MPDARRGPPYRAEHIGSLLRPQPLIDARARFATGRLSALEMHKLEDDAIREAVRLQEDMGFQAVTDGEFRRGMSADPITTAFTGIKIEPGREQDIVFIDSAGHREPGPLPVVYAPIRWQPSRSTRDFGFVKGLTNRVVKYTMPGPGFIHFRAGRRYISREVYPNLTTYWSDLITAYQTEIGALADAGCTYIQFDETSLIKLIDPTVRAAIEARGDNPDQMIATYIAALNAVVAGSPPEITYAVHLCRGNRRNHWVAQGGYDALADRLFRGMRIGTYFLECDTARAGGFEALAKLPEGKRAVLGLISTKDAAKHVPLDRLAISPQCGFATDVRGNRISLVQEIGKLRRTVEVAQTVWG